PEIYGTIAPLSELGRARIRGPAPSRSGGREDRRGPQEALVAHEHFLAGRGVEDVVAADPVHGGRVAGGDRQVARSRERVLAGRRSVQAALARRPERLDRDRG